MPILTPEQIESFRALLKGGTISTNSPRFEDAFDLLATTPHGHVAAVLGTMEKLGIPDLLARNDSPERRDALALIAGRVLSPGSKLALSRHLSGKSSTLAEQLSLSETLTEDNLYRSMKWLVERQQRIQKSLAIRHLGEGSLIPYDLSSSYDEGSTCPIADYGWISALRSTQINKLVQSNELQPKLFNQRDLAEIESIDYPDERLVVCRNPALARKRHHPRQDLIQATEIVLEKIRIATLRK